MGWLCKCNWEKVIWRGMVDWWEGAVLDSGQYHELIHELILWWCWKNWSFDWSWEWQLREGRVLYWSEIWLISLLDVLKIMASYLLKNLYQVLKFDNWFKDQMIFKTLFLNKPNYQQKSKRNLTKKYRPI